MAIVVIVTVFAIFTIPAYGADFIVFYRAGVAAVSGINPYTLGDEVQFFPPFWTLAVFAPMSMLPVRLAQFIWPIAAMTVWVFILNETNAGSVNIGLFLLNAPFVRGMMLGSYDWMCLIGVLLPIGLGSWFLILKPQVSFGYIFFQLKERGIKQLAPAYILPGLLLIGATLISLSRTPVLSEMWWNTSLGFIGLPIGGALLFWSFKKRNQWIALAATPFLFPYVGIAAWAVTFFAVIHDRRLLIVCVILSWVLICL